MGIFSKTEDPEAAWSRSHAAYEDAQRRYAEKKRDLENRMAEAEDPAEIAGELDRLEGIWAQAKREHERRCKQADEERTRARQAGARSKVQEHIASGEAAIEKARSEWARNGRKALVSLLGSLRKVDELKGEALREVRLAHSEGADGVFEELAEARARELGTTLRGRRNRQGYELQPLAALADLLHERALGLEPLDAAGLQSLRELMGDLELLERRAAVQTAVPAPDPKPDESSAAERRARDLEAWT
jgi:hypothetical protein